MSRLEEYEWMIKYFKLLDPTNAKILEGLGRYGPRNLSALAKSIKLPSTTVAFRMKKLEKEGFLKIRTNLNYSRLGLMKAVLITESEAGRTKELQQVISNLDYWTYMVRCYGKFDGYYTTFAFPAEFKNELAEYLHKAAQLKVFSRFIFHHTTNFSEVAPNFDNFDFRRKSWSFEWKHWTDEVRGASDRLLESLSDPKAYPVRADETDILILKELEKDASMKFTELAQVANITSQGVRYRFREHIMERHLITDYEVATLPYPLPTSEMCSFIIDFEDKEKLARFANSLQDKPFVITFAKLIGQDSLVVHTYVPRTEFSRLIDSMNRLAEQRLVEGFIYVILDVASFRRQTISYECFNKNRWTYDSKTKLERLVQLTSK